MAKHSDHVCAALRQVWSTGRRPLNVFVRSEFCAIADRDSVGIDDHSERRPRPPIVQFLTPHGIALQAYLVALFESRCRLLPGAEPTNERPLRPDNRNPIGWLNLVGSYAQASTQTSRERATITDNRLRQLKNALKSLADANLVELNPSRNSNRFEFFQLLDESGLRTHDGQIRYRIPIRDRRKVIILPREFFLQGWIHVLSPSEIATYLMLRHLSQLFPDRHKEEGVFINGYRREATYGLSRDTYENHFALAGYGLISLVPNPERRNDGRIKNFHDKMSRGLIVEPHRFRVHSDRALLRPALPVVTEYLRRRSS